MTDVRDSLTFKVRALVQAHPLSSAAHRYVNQIVERERRERSPSEIGVWAGYALTTGYSLRRLEEVEVIGERLAADESLSFEQLDASASELAGAIRTSGAEHHHLLPESVVVGALDDLIGGEIDRRLDALKGQIGEEAMGDLEEYIAWWLVKGYALRIAETLNADEPGRS